MSLQDLNYDCLKEIFKLLDMPSQFSLINACDMFKPIILYDIWYPHYKCGFDLKYAPALAELGKDFQSNALGILLRNYTQVKNIPPNLLNKCLHGIANEEFDLMQYLSIVNEDGDPKDNILDTQQLCRFPNLMKLKLDRVAIQGAKNAFPNLKRLYLDHITLTDDKDGEFLRNIFTAKMRTLLLISLPFERIPYERFSTLSECVNLKELCIASEYIHDSLILDPLVNLPSLEILTLQTRNTYYFDCRDHCIFQRILRRIHESRQKLLEGVQMNGMPKQCFFSSHHLKRIKKLNWMVDSMHHRKTSGCVEWTSDLPMIILSYYDFIETNRHLETLYVRDNIFHLVKMRKEPEFNASLQETREKLHNPALNIVTSYRGLTKNPYIVDLQKGFIKFIFKLLY